MRKAGSDIIKSRRPTSRLPRPDDSEILRAADEVCRRDFLTFASWCFNELTPGIALLANWHLEALAFRLEQIRRGEIKKLIINLPPRYGKSIFASIALPAFVLGHDPTARIIAVSYGWDLAVKLANDCRQILNSVRYENLFATRISRKKNTETEVVTTQGGYRLASSIDGTLTGRGGDIIIVDDPLKPSDALSNSKRERVNDRFGNTLVSRLDDKRSGAIIVAMQRLHVDDLCGRLLRDSDEWTVLSLPAIAEEDEQIPIGEGRYYQRRAGEALHAQREPISVLSSIRSQLGSDTFAAQYQQCPIPSDGAMIKRSWIRRYDKLPVRTGSSYVLQSWDTAVKSGGEHDYSVCATFLVHERNYYVLDVLRARFDFPTLRQRARSHGQQYSPNCILVEDDFGVGTALSAELKEAGFTAIAIKPEGDKLTRMSIQSAKIEGKRLILPHQAPWLADFEDELFAFPNAPHDDQIDALSQALTYDDKNQKYIWTDKAIENFGRFVEALSFPFN